jgi:hypothetical protein
MVTILQSRFYTKSKILSVITTSDDTLTTEEEVQSPIESSEEEENDQQDNHTLAICDCGRRLDPSWQCVYCRRACSVCNRALSLDPEEYCERCFRLCKYHGLYSLSGTSVECPLCNKS